MAKFLGDYRETQKRCVTSNLEDNRVKIKILEIKKDILNKDTDEYKKTEKSLTRLWNGVNNFLDKWLHWKLPKEDEYGNDVPYED